MLQVHYRETECVDIIGNFGDESFQAINCTGTDSQTTTNTKYTKHKITNPNTNKLALEKNPLKPTGKSKTIHL